MNIEPQNKEPQNIEVNTIAFFFSFPLLFEISCSIFDILFFPCGFAALRY